MAIVRTPRIDNRRWRLGALALATGIAAAPAAWGQAAATAAPPSVRLESWQVCSATPDGAARLACFDRWAQQQQSAPAAAVAPASSVALGIAPPPALPVVAGVNGCQDNNYSSLSRFWELQKETDCGTFELRGYRPISMDIVASDGVNNQPTSPAAGRSATTAESYRDTETRIQLSARIKVAKNLLTRGNGTLSDSLWVGFTQQSYWQFFSGGISRPFRTTDYEPEAMYIYPLDVGLPGGMRLRYAGLGISHQSNGRTLPLSRSWNRGILMAGLDLDSRFSLEGRIWKRLGESGGDDNPDITDLIGRGELTATWHADAKNTFSGTVRTAFGSNSNGSVRLEYFRALGRGNRVGNLNDLRLHVQAFSGYGDSLLDYNRKRNVFSVGLALVDW
ncbi:MAG: phospholipase A [Burkholderiales bacterium]|nr:phospholipase A [Burkholderiales bacterium]